MLNLEPGALFGGRYEIIRAIGAGGMGAVYLACDPRFRDFLVALKVLYPGVIKSRESRERFRNEIVASYRVNHRNVVRAYEYFDEEDFQAYAMEHVDGGDLSEQMAGRRVEYRYAIDILAQIAAGLEAIHAMGIVHRDLKPENILVTKAGVAKISDFGVARLKGSITLTQAGAMVGTPKYVSPEYIETGECDHRGDIYAVGVIGYELISGRSPFRSDSRVSMMMERFKKDPADLLTICPECPPVFVEIIKKAMAVDLSSRYQSAAELREDLELLVAGKEPRHCRVGVKPEDQVTQRRISFSERVSSSAAYRIAEELRAPRFSMRTVLGGVMVAALVAVMGVATWRKVTSHSLLELPEGVYHGSVSGVLADNLRHGFTVWRTDRGAYVLFGKESCSVTPVGSDSRFKCGDLAFELNVDSVERGNAVGTIEETSWGSSGTWSVTAER